jgi:hypothetical protein
VSGKVEKVEEIMRSLLYEQEVGKILILPSCYGFAPKVFGLKLPSRQLNICVLPSRFESGLN